MSFIGRMLDRFIGDEEPDLTRRTVIKGAAGLAALVCAGGAGLSLIEETKSIEAQIASGLVHGKTFYCDKTIVIDMPNVIISDCKFIFTKPVHTKVLIKSSARYTRIINSSFLGEPSEIGAVVEPSSHDRTDELNSAIAGNAGVIYLQSGTYKISSPIISSGNSHISGYTQIKPFPKFRGTTYEQSITTT